VPAGPARNRTLGRLRGSAGTTIRLPRAAMQRVRRWMPASVSSAKAPQEFKKPRGAPRGGQRPQGRGLRLKRRSRSNFAGPRRSVPFGETEKRGKGGPAPGFSGKRSVVFPMSRSGEKVVFGTRCDICIQAPLVIHESTPILRALDLFRGGRHGRSPDQNRAGSTDARGCGQARPGLGGLKFALTDRENAPRNAAETTVACLIIRLPDFGVRFTLGTLAQ